MQPCGEGTVAMERVAVVADRVSGEMDGDQRSESRDLRINRRAIARIAQSRAQIVAE